MIRKIWLLLAFLLTGMAFAQNVTLTGTLQAANGLTASNYLIAFKPSQFFFIANTSVVINTTVFCATSADGSVVATSNPSNPLVGAVNFTGTLPPAIYYIQYAWYDAAGHITLPSAEQTLQLTANGQLSLSPPTSGAPATAVGMKIYIGTASGAETLQGTTTGSATFVQSVPLISGAALPTVNNTICSIVANDAGWPVGTGYQVTLSDPSGNTSPGYPMMWRLLGPNTTINLSNGLPLYNGQVIYPVPILATPFNHNVQSISGPLSLSGYNLLNVNRIGVGTSLPAWPLDIENGMANASGGYLVNGAASTAGKCLGSDGTAYNTPLNCITSLSLFYQFTQLNGSGQTQEPALNFVSRFSLTDTPGASTNVDLAHSGVTAGSYTNPNLTVDIFGRVTAASNGAVPGGLDEYWSAPTCTFPTDNNGESCTETVTLPSAFPDATYWLNCTPVLAAGSPASRGYVDILPSTKTASQFQLILTEDWGDSAGAGNSWQSLDCHAHHN